MQKNQSHLSRPYVRDLQFRGVIEGLTYLDKPSANPLCHFFGGIPYALPPVGPYRFQKPRALPACYRYGTKVNPGRFVGGCGVCPQPGMGMDGKSWDEDCLQLNVWVPVGEPPDGGWPVLFWIHGGFLQFGSPNGNDHRAMLSESPVKCIIVAPAYRLNILGFLASPELLNACPSDFCTNLGFWDQRLALEWTWQNISYFGGNASNITIAGYSAGSHSTFYQLAYDLGLPDKKRIVKRAMMLSNGPGMQPKSLSEIQSQFEELLKVLNIDLTLSPREKLAKLRNIDSATLLKATFRMKYHQFRAVTDGSFVRHTLFSEFDNGIFAQKMKYAHVKLLIGECKDEHFVYGEWRPPAENIASLHHRLQADYPFSACDALISHYFPTGSLTPTYETWKEAFGHIYADIQIHALERGMVNALVKHGAGDLVHRYRIEWRAKCVDKKYSKSWGVTHTSDMPIWFWGNGWALEEEEKRIVRHAFHEQLALFIQDKDVNWGTRHALQIRTLKPDGSIAIEEDEALEEGIRVWNVLSKAGAMGGSRRESKL